MQIGQISCLDHCRSVPVIKPLIEENDGPLTIVEIISAKSLELSWLCGTGTSLVPWCKQVIYIAIMIIENAHNSSWDI